VDGCGDPGRAELAERLLWSGQYIGDVNRMREDLVARPARSWPPAATIRPPRTPLIIPDLRAGIRLFSQLRLSSRAART